MPLIDARLKPGQWQIEKIGASGRRYRLRFQGTRFYALSRLEEWDKGPAWNRPLYWRRLYTAYDNNRHPHGKLVLEGFADLGITTKVAVAGFIAAQHTQIKGVD